MANEDVLLTAALDPTAVERALEQIERRVDQMVRASNKKMQVMGQATKQVAMLAQSLVTEFNAVGAAGMSVDQKKRFVKLQKEITGVADGLDGLIKLMRDMEDIDVSAVQGELPRSMFRDLIEKEIAKIDGSLLEKKLGAMMDSANEHLAVRAKALRDDLIKMMKDPTLSGKELAAQVKIIEGNIDDLADRLGSVPTTLALGREQAQDVRVQELGRIEGKDLQDRLYRAIKQTEGGVTDLEKQINQSASKIREDLVRALKDPTLTGKELRAEINRLEKEFEEATEQARAMQQTAAQGAGLSLGGRQDVQARQVSRIIGDAQAQEIQQQIEMLMRSSEEKVREGAVRIKGQLQGILDVKPEGDEYIRQLDKLQAKAKDLAGIPQADLVSEEEAAQIRAVDLQIDKLNQNVQKSAGVVSASASANIAAEQGRAQAYADAARAGRISYDTAISKIKQANSFVVQSTAVYKQAQDAVDEYALAQAEAFSRVEIGPLEQQLLRLMQSSREEVTRTAAIIQTRLNEALALKEGDELIEFIRQLQADADKLDRAPSLDLIDAEEIAQADRLQTLLADLDQAAARAAEGASERGLKSIRTQQQAAQSAVDNAEATARGQAKAEAAVNKAITAVKRSGRVYRETKEEVEALGDAQEEVAEQADAFAPTEALIRAKKASQEYESTMRDISVLQKSSKQEVRDLANELDRVGKEAKESFDRGESEAEDFERSVNRLTRATKDMADVYGEEIPSGANNARVSLWKLGNVADRVGFRGAGGATQLVDALKGIPIAAVAGVVALAGLAAAVVKITQALIEMGKKAAMAFGEFTKGAVESAKAVQVTDQQLGGFLRAPELGKGYRKLLQDMSFDVGLDLTKDFARVIVPLARDVDEVEKAAEIAGTLAHAFQETDDAIANAIKQAAGGHFRPLIERFGLTEFEIERIRQAQERSGEFTGVLEGLAAALEFRGLDISTLSGTLQFIQGQMEVVRKQVEITFGEPVRDALSEQFQKLFDIVEDRKGPLMDFFEGLGETVGGVIDAIGDVLVGFADDISDEDIVDFEGAIKELGENIEEVIERLGEIFSSEDRSLVDVAIDLTEALQEVATQLEEILILIREAKKLGSVEIPGVGRVSSRPRLLPFDIGAVTSVTGLAANAVDVAQGSEPDLERVDELLFKIGGRLPIIGTAVKVFDAMGGSILNTADAADAATDAIGKNTDEVEENKDALRDLINQHQELSAELQDLEELQLDAAKAQEKITEAEEKLASQRSMREEEIRTRFARQEIEAEVKRSEKREDLFENHMRRMLQLTDKYNSDVDKAELSFDRKGEDNEQKYQDKLQDIARDTTEKKIDIEKKYRERLRDIRAKFDLDAEEAIRRNDAVALLRIRRRMKLELETAKQNRDDQIKEAEDVDKKKRDNAKVWLDRQERDLEIAEQRKLDDLLAADEERRRQLIDQYLWEYQQIDKQYERQRIARDEKLKQAIEDMNKQFDVREAEMAKSLEAEYAIVKKWKDKETDYMRLKLQEQANLVEQQYQLWTREGSLFSQFMTGNVLSPQNFNPLNPTGPTGIGSRLTPETNPFTPLTGGFGRQHGGYVSTGNVYGINERGPEPFYATRAGIIASRDSLMMSPAGYRGSVQIDNSRSVNAGDIYAMDPDKMSPIDRTLMASMFTEQLLAHGL